MKKILFFLTVLLCCAMVFGGGASQSSGGTSSGTAKLSVAIAENLRIEDYKTNLQTKLIEQNANVDLSFVVLPSTDFVNRLNLMVMAGGKELPDIILARPGDAVVFQWAQEGAIVPLTKYYKDPSKSPTIQETFTRMGRNYLSDITSPDGEIYGCPVYNQSLLNEMDAKYMYYKPWVDNLGLKFPTTTAEYPDFLKAIVKSNPNGQNNIIPLTGMFDLSQGDYCVWFNWLMNSFVYAGDSRLLTVTNGKIGVAYNTNEWRDGLKFIRSLFADGLIPTETLTQDRNQMVTLVNQDGPVVFSFVRYNADDVNANNPAGMLYDSALPLKGPQGANYVRFIPSVAQIGMMVSVNCKDVDAAFRVGDFMCSRVNGFSTRFGAEGIDWDFAENVPNAKDKYAPMFPGYPLSVLAYDDANFWGGTKVANSSWRDQGPAFRNYADNAGVMMPIDVPAGRTGINARIGVMYQSDGVKPKEFIPKLIYTSDEIKEVTELFNNLTTYLNSSTAAFLSGNLNIDASWNTYINELNNINVQRMIDIVQKVYDRMYK